jgi:PAS domain-containing protein
MRPRSNSGGAWITGDAHRNQPMSKHPHQLDHLLKLVGDVYEAALDEGRWANLAPQIARTFNSTSSNLQIQRLGVSSQILAMTENVNAGINAYRAHYWQRDIWVERCIQRVGFSKVGTSKEMVADVEFQESEFYRDWCRHLDVFYVIGAVFPSGQDKLGVLGIHRPRSAGNYAESDKALLSRFLPHLQGALRVRDRLGQAAMERQLSLETLDRSETGILLVTGDGLIVFANRQAEALIASGTGIRSGRGRLTAIRSNDAERLTALIRGACGLAANATRSDGVASIQRANQRPLSVLVAPFRLTWAGQPAAGAIVFVRDPGRSITATATLRALFQLTPTEARIAEALANGETIAEIATIEPISKQCASS